MPENIRGGMRIFSALWRKELLIYVRLYGMFWNIIAKICWNSYCFLRLSYNGIRPKIILLILRFSYAEYCALL